MKKNDYRGVGAPLADVLPPAFDADFVDEFFFDNRHGAVEALEHANNKVKPLDLSYYAAPSHGADPVEFPAEAVELAEDANEGQTDGRPASPEAAENALTGLGWALEHASSDLQDLAQPLRVFATHDDHDHGEQVLEFEDAEAKPSWAGGNTSTDDSGATTKKGKGHNKDTTTNDGTTTNDTTTTNEGTPGTDTTESNTGSDDPNVYVSGLDTPDGFNIELLFDGFWTDTQRGYLETASEIISDFITGDVTNHNGIDDIQITITQATLDGSGGAWATGGPRSIRSDSLLPSTGVVTFDEADVSSLDSKGLWGDLGLHEMMHAMGFGTLFKAQGLVETIGDELRFTGANAIDAYNNEFVDIATNDSLSDHGVQLDSSGAHWHDGTFTKELMTPYLRLSGNYLSDMSLAAMEDMGYDTTYGDAVTIA